MYLRLYPTHTTHNVDLPSARTHPCLSLSAIVMVPSRELALQTAGIAKEMSKYLKIQVMTTTGGTKLQDDIVRLYDPGQPFLLFQDGQRCLPCFSCRSAVL
jgi:superfamily II DNA/RNA helicase